VFKEKYIDFIRSELLTLLPDGYTLKVVEEMGGGAKESPKFQIVVYVKFGVGSKQTNTTSRINQPVIFSVVSEGGDFRVARKMLQEFFEYNSKTHSSLLTDNGTYDLWHNYNTPVVQTGIDQIGTYQRMTVLLTGLVSYSKTALTGVKYYLKHLEDLNYTELEVINPQTQYNTQNLTPQYINEDVGKYEIEGANNTVSLSMLAGNDAFSKELIETSIIGTTRKYMLKIWFSDDLTFEFLCVPTTVANSHDTASGDNIITATFGAIRE